MAAAETQARREAEDRAWEKQQAQRERQERTRAPAPRARSSSRESVGEAFAKSMLRSIGSQVGRELLRGVLGSLKRR